jgi:hypothetical protein
MFIISTIVLFLWLHHAIFFGMHLTKTQSSLFMWDPVVCLAINGGETSIRLGCNGLAIDMVETAKLLSMWWFAQRTELNLVECAISSMPYTYTRAWSARL